MLNKLQKAGSTYFPYNINVVNELFYRFADMELINELPNLFTKFDLLNIALHKKITNELKPKAIKVMELASGKKMDRWETFKKIDKKRKWRVLLTDFDKTLLPLRARGSLSRRQVPNTITNVDNFKFITDVYSLFNNFPKLKPDEKHDVMLSTYTFDNLWLENDFHLTKVNDSWYKSLYRLDLSKVGERIGDINKGKRLNRQFFKDLGIKMRRTKIKISSLKHGAHIDKYYENYKNVSVNYPGGLIETIVNSYTNQLKKEGIFITADIATTDSKQLMPEGHEFSRLSGSKSLFTIPPRRSLNSKKTKGFKSVNETIKIKIENYALAKYILEKLGFSVELKNLHEFIKEAGIVTPVKIHDHFVLVVKLEG